MKDSPSQLVDKFSDLKILVLGDFLLDQFVFGEISRVSREAPVLILKYQNTHSVPGGGANTVANVESLGAKAIPLGFVGDDEPADLLFSSWPEGLEKRYVFRGSEFQTNRKARILAGSFHSFRQQVVRMDYEHPFFLEEHHERKLLQCLSDLIPQVDTVILSDYSLGNINSRVRESVLALAAQHGKIIVVDSRDSPDLHKGATSITPNITEIEAALSIQIGKDLSLLEEVGSRLLQEWQLQALLVTRGKLGMSLFVKDGITHIPIYGTDEVADVTGAGDTVTATYTTALAAGGSFQQAARLANYAGGIVVMKRGTATVSQAELRQAVEDHP
ncbi:bifunctional ADP-heptose synthase [Acidobacteria bacterium AH-259-L09]|nr:bifunctional ADP-heptose synthase [Acidobacteria bacterium AH-259-L09]